MYNFCGSVQEVLQRASSLKKKKPRFFGCRFMIGDFTQSKTKQSEQNSLE